MANVYALMKSFLVQLNKKRPSSGFEPTLKTMCWIVVRNSTAVAMEQLFLSNGNQVRNDEFISGPILIKKNHHQDSNQPEKNCIEQTNDAFMV